MCASSLSTTPRIERKQTPPRYFFAHRKYLKYLRIDFQDRCAYSGQHIQRVGGLRGMDIDHHNPKLRHPEKNAYKNLFLATRHCNGKKSDHWPDAKKRALGIRFVNPCVEPDYGLHLFEDPKTFEIWGATTAGRYHVRMLDLNADHLVRERKRRHELRQLITLPQAVNIVRDDALVGVRAFLKEVREMIPDWPQRQKPLLPQ